MEIVLRDCCPGLDDGKDSMAYMQGDCYQIYVKLYESGLMAGVDLRRLKTLSERTN